jgi:hypothetical protein
MYNLFYLHVWSQGEHDSDTQYDSLNRSAINIGLELYDWPDDDLFQSWSEFFVTNRLASKLSCSGLTGFELSPVARVSKAFGFSNMYPDFETDKYYHLKLNRNKGQSDLSLWNNSDLVVSSKALSFLRKNNVLHAESDIILPSIEAYFNSDKMYFWMKDGASKDYFLNQLKEQGT